MQKVVVDTAGKFVSAVEKLLVEGWVVIPGTVAGGTYFVCFLEKPQIKPVTVIGGSTPKPPTNTEE